MFRTVLKALDCRWQMSIWLFGKEQFRQDLLHIRSKVQAMEGREVMSWSYFTIDSIFWTVVGILYIVWGIWAAKKMGWLRELLK